LELVQYLLIKKYQLILLHLLTLM